MLRRPVVVATAPRALSMALMTALMTAFMTLWIAGAPSPLRAQEPGEQAAGGGQFAGMQRVGGEVTAIAGATVTIKTEERGVMQIVTTDNTRVMKGRGVTVKVADLKVGDGVMALGNLDAPNKTMHAAMLLATDGAQLKMLRDNLGKTYIAGKVTAVDADNAKMTIERPDKVSQTIGFDETTSFKRGGRSAMGGLGGGMGGGPGAQGPRPQGQAAGGRGTAGSAADTGESITLADVKVGDNVRGTGAIKGGVFVPTEFVVVVPGQGGRRRGEGAVGSSPSAPAGPGI